LLYGHRLSLKGSIDIPYTIDYVIITKALNLTGIDKNFYLKFRIILKDNVSLNYEKFIYFAK